VGTAVRERIGDLVDARRTHIQQFMLQEPVASAPQGFVAPGEASSSKVSAPSSSSANGSRDSPVAVTGSGSRRSRNWRESTS
jgi:hypothetical protein